MEKTADLCLRRAGEEDCERLSAIAFTAKAHWGYDAAFMEACRAELTFDAGRVKAEHIVIAERGGAPAGFYSLLPGEAPGCGEVGDMFVLPAHMGKGIGRALMEDLIRAARTRGMTRLEVDADPMPAPSMRGWGSRVLPPRRQPPFRAASCPAFTGRFRQRHKPTAARPIAKARPAILPA